ncbi:Golgi-specific brefeldin A-resistance guanine nucleotide exchange factor 1-like [Trichoplusia ni]|uniref:Golgi-specific brefeldin A-resistance guanine nucleotide exchange factor 1-like n=1 Tax=Trichoplusia ni TaxID=7111 RepID=A0A7E5X0X0_TRINI|nr:Golgi-specific brefeldin A-resistance guanine nucleotide exchange factor 1-like [Trichoplusia ni]
MSVRHSNGVALGQSSKAQFALRRACAAAVRHADCVRDSRRHLLEIVKTLYIGRLLPKWVTQGTEMFNQKPERGIEFLQEHGVLTTPLDPHEVAIFLRENPDLDKKMIREYICKRSSRGEDEDGGPSVLGAFADIFDYAGLRIDQALRLYLETFRLPGEEPLNFRGM